MTARLIATVHAKRDASGGMIAVDAHGCEVIDTVPSHGMAVSPQGDRVARLTRTGGEGGLTHLMISDRDGLVLSRRVPVVEPHSLLWTIDGLIAASTGTNSLIWFDETGNTTRSWSPGGDGDCWHLNCLTTHGGHVLVAAFGMFGAHRAWTQLDGAGQGLVYDVDAGTVVLGGLHCPHDVLRLGERWLVCNSGDGEVIRIDASDPDDWTAQRTQLGGWTRGLVVVGDRFAVGVTPRRSSDSTRARVAFVDEDSLDEVDSIEIPAPNIYALAMLDEDLVEGILRSSRMTSMMSAPDTFVDGPLDAADCDAEVRVLAVDRTLDHALVDVVVTNRGTRTYASVGTHPVHLGVRGRTDDATLDLDRHPLPRPIRPGRSLTFSIDVATSGRVIDELHLGLVQDQVRWFDEVAPAATASILTGEHPGLGVPA